jgi:hypothetical protein
VYPTAAGAAGSERTVTLAGADASAARTPASSVSTGSRVAPGAGGGEL